VRDLRRMLPFYLSVSLTKRLLRPLPTGKGFNRFSPLRVVVGDGPPPGRGFSWAPRIQTCCWGWADM
jgi:hypothetical protein